MPGDLVSFRRAASRFLVPLIWAHTPVIALVALSNGIPVWRPTFIMVLGATVATVAVLRNPGGVITRCVVAAALTLAPMLMVYAGAGLWQIDWHMYFFVVFGMLVAYVDWRPVALSALLTAAHHAILSVLFPAAVFPEADLPRVGLHAAIVIVDAIVLFRIIRQIKELYTGVSLANDALERRIAERTVEVNTLNDALEKKVDELEDVVEQLKNEVAERRDVSVRLDHLAHHDIVTGLPNRALVMDRLAIALANAARTDSEVLVLYIDLGGFKTVNDANGHAAGDRALAAIALRLNGCLRTGDTAGRVGGDEFVVVCSVKSAMSEAAQIARRMIDAVCEPIGIGAGIHLGANIGVSLYPADGDDPGELVRKADAAMYRSKEVGNNTFNVYTAEIHERMLARTTLQHDLEAALRRDEFVVFYQPIVSLTSGKIIGAEALVRWKHPLRGLLGPDAFVGFAEEHGLIGPIGEVVMRQACSQIKRFTQRAHGEFTMAVNVSAMQFRQGGFVGSVAALLEEFRIDSAQLEVEITESVVMHDVSAATATLQALAMLGVKLSIDDFGTGYSSLSYIKSFPVNTLKIDRSFVVDVADNATDQAIAATIITLAHNLGMRVIAEGIETREQLEQLRALGADDMQGYLVSRPIAADEFERFVAAYGRQELAA